VSGGERRRAPGRPRWGRILLVGVVVGYLALLMLAPIVALIFGALDEGLGELASALADPKVIRAFGLTLVISMICVVVHGVFGTIVAWVLARQRFPGQRFLNGLIDLPFAISPVVAGYMLLLLFGRRGLLAPLLDAMGWKVAFAFPGMVLATLFVTLPFMVRELTPALEAFGTDQEQAAATLGARPWQIFRFVTFPALRSAFLYGAVLTFARALGEFGAVLVVGGGVQGRTETLTLYIYRALDDRQYAGAYGAALVLGALSLALVLGAEFLRKQRP
jgi:sulfate transport system permease protein